MTDGTHDSERGAPAEGARTWRLRAEPRNVSELRSRARQYAESHGADHETVSAITLAVSEGVTNAVMHAFLDREPGVITLTCAAGPGELCFLIADDGRGIRVRTDSPGMGTGLSTMGKVATRMDVRPGPTGGTIVELAFDAAGVHAEGAVACGEDEGRLLLAASELARSAAWPVEGVERLCDLVLHTFADAACVDVVEHGCLRRLAAGVHGDERLTAQLVESAPPLKPGTATWAALRGDGPQLVVHDPSVPRSPGGVGTLLDLSWWLSIPLTDANGVTLGLWGLGGRAGRPVPAATTIALLAEAGTRATGALANARVLAGMQATRRRLEGVLSALSEAVTVTDSAGRIAYANEAAARLMGAASAAELTAGSSNLWLERFRMTDQQGEEVRVDQLPGRRLHRGEDVESLVTRNVDKTTGRVRWLRTTSRVLDPGASFVVDIVEDVTQTVGAERRHRVMIEIGDVLDGPRSVISAVQAVAELLVPELTDGCAVDLLDEDHALRRVALAHPEEAQRARLRALRERWPSFDLSALSASGPSGARVMALVTDEVLQVCAEDADHLAALRELGWGSVVVVELRAARRPIGRLTLAHDGRSGRSFDATDVGFAVDVGRRIATAVALAGR